MSGPNNSEPKQGGLSWSTPSKAPQQAAPMHTTPPPPSVPPKPPATPPQGRSGISLYAGMIALGVVAGVVIAWGFSALRGSEGAVSERSTTTVETRGSAAGGAPANSAALGVDVGSAPALGSDPGLTILSPQPAGSSVSVLKAIVSQPTWIVVYDNKDGKPGNALGAGLFFPETQKGTVELLRPTLAGKSYLAVKQVDNGDRKFQLHDDPFLSEGGEVQWVTFEVR